MSTRRLSDSLSDEFRTLAENSPDVIVRYDRQCRRVYVNPAFESVNGIPASQVIGKSPIELASARTVAGDTAQALQGLLANVMHSGKPASMDMTWNNDMGQAVCFELRAVPEFDDAGEVVTVLTVARDASAQREVTRQLSLLSFALDQVSEALYLMDEEARLLQVNNEACRVLGYSRDELLGMRLVEIAPEFSPEAWREQQQHMKTARSNTSRSVYRSRAGRLIPVEVNASLFEFDKRLYTLFLARDISKSLAADLELKRHAEEFRALAENSPDTIVRYDLECRRLYVNSAFLRESGLSPEVLLGKRPSDTSPLINARAYETELRIAIASGKARQFEYSWSAPDGRICIRQAHLAPEFSADGQVTGILAVGRDITAAKETEQRLEQAEALARIGHWQWDFIRRESLVSATACRIFDQAPGWTPALEDVLALIVDEDRDRVVQTFLEAYDRQDGEVAYTYRIRCGKEILHLHSHAQIHYAPDGKPRSLMGTIQDISELKSYESRLHEMAFHDTLTGLPNRALLNDRLRQSLAEATRRGTILGLLVLDLDRFKEINDTHGHGVGDRLLYESAERLRNQVRDYDTVARLGGDEFAIVLPDVREAADLGTISRKILDAFVRPFRIGDQDLFISASIGIAVFPSDGATPPDLLQYADSALYDAKDRGRAGFRFYSTKLTAKSKERSMLEAALRRAEPEGELELYYQPKIDLANGALIGAEALLRWNHPTLGLVPPDRFIGIAEDTGLIVGMGAWVLTKACLAAQEWNQRGTGEFKMAVNLSSYQFRNDNLVATVRSVLALTGCEPHWLELEITESLLLDDNQGVHQTLSAFRDMGISIAIDDFGTGYSALGYLKRFPIDVLKIDRSFTRDVMLDRDSTELVKAVITMAQSLRLTLVAEGIETEDQECFLQAHGCHLGQGYRYSKPVPKAAFEALPLMAGTRIASCGDE